MTIPTRQILLDNFTGAFGFDITQYVRLVDGITFGRGRSDEFAQAGPGSLSLTLDNTDGRFTLGSATYGIALDQQIRVKVNGTTMWTGYVQQWPVAWPTGGQEYSTVQVTAVDAFARMARRTLRSALEEDVLVDDPNATYPLSEAEGATAADDTSGNGLPSLGITGTGTPFTFGSGTGPADGLTCASFLGGTFLRNTIPAVYLASGLTAWTVECYFATTQVPATTVTQFVVLDAGSGSAASSIAAISMTSAGKLIGSTNVVSVTSAASVNDGLVHHAVVTLTGGTMTLYLDGVSVGTVASSTLPDPLTRLSLAPSDIGVAGVVTPYVGTLAHVSVYPTALSVGRLSVHNGGTVDHAGESPAGRYARVSAYCAVPTGTLDTGGTTVLGPANQGGRDALDVVNETADATLGFVMVTGDGSISSMNGSTLTAGPFLLASMDAAYADPGTSVEADLSFLVNDATGGSTSSENTHNARNAASIGNGLTGHGVYHKDFTWNVSTDDQAEDRTNWMVANYAEPVIRVSSLTFDALTGGALNDFNLGLLDVGTAGYLRVTGFPNQITTTQDLIVQGITWTLTDTAYTVTVNCTQRSLYTAWILGDATYGVLGSTTKLYVA